MKLPANGSGGHRAFNILQVATATVKKAKVFLTFDKNQRIPAKMAGLEVKP